MTVSDATISSTSREAIVTLEPRDGSELVARLEGDWRLTSPRPDPKEVARALEERSMTRLAFDAKKLGVWDTSLLMYVWAVQSLCAERKVDVDRAGLPPGVDRLIRLSEEVPETEAQKKEGRPSFVA